MQTTSGLQSASHSSTRSSRALRELTFQVTRRTATDATGRAPYASSLDPDYRRRAVAFFFAAFFLAGARLAAAFLRAGAFFAAAFLRAGAFLAAAFLRAGAFF